MLNRLHRLVSRGYPARRPAMLRVVFGLVAVVRGFEAYRIIRPLALSDVVHIPYMEWMPEPTSLVISSLVVLWLTSGVAFTIGYRTGVAGALLTFSMASVLLIDQQAYSNHLYLFTVMVGLLTLARPGGDLSIDSRRRRTHTTSVAWPLVLMKLQVSVLYLFAALTKLNVDFLSGRVLAGQLGRGIVPFPEGLRTVRMMMTLAVLSVAIEVIIAIYLWHPQRRFIAVGAGVLLHGVIPLVMTPFVQLAVFSMIMLASYLLFIPADGPRSVEAPPGLAGLVSRLDWLDIMDVSPARALVTRRGLDVQTGWQAAVNIGDELPGLYLATPFLRLPLIRNVAKNWLERRSAQVTV